MFYQPVPKVPKSQPGGFGSFLALKVSPFDVECAYIIVFSLRLRKRELLAKFQKIIGKIIFKIAPFGTFSAVRVPKTYFILYIPIVRLFLHIKPDRAAFNRLVLKVPKFQPGGFFNFVVPKESPFIVECAYIFCFEFCPRISL